MIAVVRAAGRRGTGAPPAEARLQVEQHGRERREEGHAWCEEPDPADSDAVGGRVPRKQRESGASDHAPDERPAAKTVAHGGGAYLGWLLTSRSHRSSRRLRSALAPYFAKS